MKKLICLIASTMLILSTSGCATNRCGNGLFGGGLFNGRLLQGGLFQDGPIRSFFRGAPCNTCNPPAGQLNDCNSNVAPLCQNGNCQRHLPTSAPANIQLNGPVPYYDSGAMAPQTVVPNAAGSSVLPQGSVIQPPQGSSSRVPYGLDELPTVDAFSNSSIDADALPPTP